VSTISFMSRV